MARKIKRYGRPNVSPKRSGQIRLIQKIPRFRSSLLMCTLYCHISSSLRTHLPGRYKHDIMPDRHTRDSSFKSVDLLLKFPKIQLVTYCGGSHICQVDTRIAARTGHKLLRKSMGTSGRPKCEVAPSSQRWCSKLRSSQIRAARAFHAGMAPERARLLPITSARRHDRPTLMWL
ncbi:hypothetical protein SLEP1_g2877 [Rubroshorea leprosula]|uniref:Uncharacterized protein n=1 Tax=Rubroshorea leprosula TaxID=152421 RepID=A0AAV5HPL0_9ROSI|nr:hypothetical protein SLEP1_g2877 [Rubroshorea leprosula]